MVISILSRKTRLKDRSQWEAALLQAMPRLRGVIEAEAGFVSVQYLWSTEDDGQFAQITTWQTLDDCRRYVRGGAAATVATIEEAAVPTAPHPDGAWVRKTYEIAL
jgi:heme-degrading monooxygenase HmoA